MGELLFGGTFIILFYFIQAMGTLIFFGAFFSIFYVAIKASSNKKQFKSNVIDYSKKEEKVRYEDISQAELETFETADLNAFKDHFYKIFYDFEMAYNNLDYHTMQLLTTKQVYQNYYTGITLSLKQGHKRIIKDIDRTRMIVFETISTTAKQAVSAVITISYINYVEDKNGHIISGNSHSKITETFELIFRKDFGKSDPRNCPNCGAPVTSNQCEFCKTVINDVEFKISSIKKIINF